MRRLDVDLRAERPGTWFVEGDPIFSHFMATLSAVFPRGEEFFVDTVRDHRELVADEPVLKAQVKAFAGQEAMHGREHRALNARLDERGYHTARGEVVIGRVLDAIYRKAPGALPLAVTAGAEHLTAIFAEAVLGHAETRDVLLPDPDIGSLLMWHSLEELEHKNVAFDVLDRVAGYLTRVAGFLIAVLILGGAVLVEWGRSVAGDGRIRPHHLRRFRRNLRRQRLLSWWAAGRLVQYLRPGFHPDDMETEALVAEWQQRLADRTTVTAGMRAAG